MLRSHLRRAARRTTFLGTSGVPRPRFVFGEAALAAAAGALAGAVVPVPLRPGVARLLLSDAVVEEQVHELAPDEPARLAWCVSSERHGPRVWRRLELRHPAAPSLCLASLEVTGTTLHSATVHEELELAAAAPLVDRALLALQPDRAHALAALPGLREWVASLPDAGLAREFGDEAALAVRALARSEGALASEGATAVAAPAWQALADRFSRSPIEGVDAETDAESEAGFYRALGARDAAADGVRLAADRSAEGVAQSAGAMVHLTFPRLCASITTPESGPCPHGDRCRFHHGTAALARAAWPDAATEVPLAALRLLPVPQSAEEAVRMAAEEGLTLRRSDNQVGYYNVLYRAADGERPYRAMVLRNGSQLSLGQFATAEEAALCYARSPEGRAAAQAAAAGGGGGDAWRGEVPPLGGLRHVDVDVEEDRTRGRGERQPPLRPQRSAAAEAYAAWRAGGFLERMPQVLARGLGRKERERRLARLERDELRREEVARRRAAKNGWSATPQG